MKHKFYEENYTILYDYGIAKIAMNKSYPLYYIITDTYGIASQKVLIPINKERL